MTSVGAAVPPAISVVVQADSQIAPAVRIDKVVRSRREGTPRNGKARGMLISLPSPAKAPAASICDYSIAQRCWNFVDEHLAERPARALD